MVDSNTRIFSLAIPMLAALLLVSCGGGGGGGDGASSEPGAPGVSITVPADGTSVAEGTSINFLATANDAEDGDLGASLNWNSNMDGDFATGSDVNAKLSVGVHTIIASVTDSGGLSGSQQIIVTVTTKQAGLDARPQNLSCIAPERRSADVAIQLEEAFPALPDIARITKVLVEPVVSPRWFVLQQTGQVLVFDPAAPTSTQLYLDFSAHVTNINDNYDERGLLGMAFHPDYPVVREIFLSYTEDSASDSVVSRLILSESDAVLEQQDIIVIDQDASNHNGGDIAFGPDRLLYIGLGDGGGSGDPNGRGQDTRNLLGSFLRIDVLDPNLSYPANAYSIPADNPFAGNPKCGPGANADNCPEIYAWGLRNPWRWSFDPDTGALWVADVGEGDWEEVNQIVRGGNYGWDCREGAHDYQPENCTTGMGLIDPVAEYGRNEGTSTTGGFVYRGAAIPGLIGRYVFGDYVSGRIWALQSDGQGGFALEELIDSSANPSVFAVDQDGELYVVDYSRSGGRILKLVAEPGELVDTVPDSLLDSGCVDVADITDVSSGLVPFEPSAPFWSDGAVKERFIALPDSTVISIDGEDDFIFPRGTVLVKNFRLDGRLIETRHLMLHPDGEWAGYTYEWNANQTAALRVRGGKTVDVAGQDWVFPAEGECMQCHTNAAGIALGPETALLNSDMYYMATDRSANQMHTFDVLNMFSAPLSGSVDELPSMPDPADAAAPLDERARAYLYTNCAQCHQPGGPTDVVLDFRYTTALQDTYACNGIPLRGNVGLDSDARIIFPGDAAKSVLIARMSRRDSVAMPPLGSTVVDDAGLALMTEWIDGLEGCN